MSVQQSQTGPFSLISCVSARETSPVDDVNESKSETKKKRFHPFRNLRRMFRRKSRHLDVADITDAAVAQERSRVVETRSCSTGRLIDDDATESRRRSSSLAPGLSLSHDSVFKPDRTDSGHSSSDLENSSLSIPILPSRFQAELAYAVRHRPRDDSDDEDLGLPRSRCSSLATDYPDKLGERAGKSQSSCSDGSLLSTGSSLDDELQDDSRNGEGSDLDLKVTRHKLSHSAAKHKMAVRPRRNHAPASKRPLTKSGSSLPVTPEVNEEPSTSWAAPLGHSSPKPASTLLGSSDRPLSQTTSEGHVSQVSNDRLKSQITIKTTSWFPEEPVSLAASTPLRLENWSKSASLPHGVALSAEAKVARSLSNAATLKTSPSDNDKIGFDKLENGIKRKELDEEEKSREGVTRSLTRTSADVKVVEDQPKTSVSKSSTRTLVISDEKDELATRPMVTSSLTRLPSTKEKESEVDGPRLSLTKSLTRSAEKRQRVDPIDIPVASGGSARSRVSCSTSPPAPTWPATLSGSLSPPKAVWPEARSEPQAERTSLFIKNETRMRRDSRDSKPPIQKSHSFHKDVPAPIYNSGLPVVKNCGEDDSNKRLYLKNRSLNKSVRKEDKDTLNTKLTKKSVSLESIGNVTADSERPVRPVSLPSRSARSASSDSVRSIILTHEEPQYANLRNLLLANFDHVHHGYENIEIIELVKKEREAAENHTSDWKKELTSMPKEKLPEPEMPRTSLEVKDPPQKPKPPADKPLAVPEFMRVQLKEAKTNTLVERRKSELQLNEDNDAGKHPIRFKKQNSLVEISSAKEEIRITKQISVHEGGSSKDEVRTKNILHPKPGENVIIVEKQQQQDEVVLRRKSQSAESDEPELMKVFARRSLKVKDEEKDLDESEGSRSRDSDKENDVAESPKEERKKEDVRSPAVPLKPVAPLKPTIVARNSLLNKYTRSLSENINSTEVKSISDMKNKINGAEKPVNSVNDKAIIGKRGGDVRLTSTAIIATKENGTDKSLEVEVKKVDKEVVLEKVADNLKEKQVEVVEEIVDGPGFKRIQDRKAEWEKRLQAAKH